MDFSLLVGVYNLDQAAKEKARKNRLSAHWDVIKFTSFQGI